MKKEYDLLGIGHILVDYVANIEEDVLEKFNLEKNVMNLRSIEFIENLEFIIRGIKKYPGSSMPNVIHGAANLGLRTALAGSISDDEDGDLFVKDLKNIGIESCVLQKKGGTGRVVNLVTPDGERTFVVNYGVAADYKPRNIDKEVLSKSRYIHFTGYEFESMNKTVMKAVKLVKRYGTKVSFDIGDPNVVLRNQKKLEGFLKKVDLVFANENEAKNFTGEDNPEKALEILSDYCEIAVVKIGREGALVKLKDASYKVRGFRVPLVNTIGAGDGFAAGFLYGLCRKKDLVCCCSLGNYYASRIVQEESARLSCKIPRWMVRSLVDSFNADLYEQMPC